MHTPFVHGYRCVDLVFQWWMFHSKFAVASSSVIGAFMSVQMSPGSNWTDWKRFSYVRERESCHLWQFITALPFTLLTSLGRTSSLSCFPLPLYLTLYTVSQKTPLMPVLDYRFPRSKIIQGFLHILRFTCNVLVTARQHLSSPTEHPHTLLGQSVMQGQLINLFCKLPDLQHSILASLRLL